VEEDMKFIQTDLGYRSGGEIVQVTLQGSAANVLLLDSSNFQAFKAGRRHRYYGGLAKRSPVNLAIPRSGHWYVVVHMGGLRGNVRASVQVLPGALPPIRQSSTAALESIRAAADEYTESGAGDQVAAPEDKQYDVFISHAAEDKEEVVRPLAQALRERGLVVWYDELELKIGDSLRRKIDAGLLASRFGVVVLSPAFFAKGWPQYELDGLVTREVTGGQPIILPVWHNVSHSQVMEYSPTLADKLARSTADTPVDQIAAEIAEVTRV
jgi:hypothetical protein